MSDFSEQIAAIEKELREIPHHKGTDHYIGKMRARIARLKDRQLEGFVKSKGGGGGGGYAVKKQGDATIVLIGPPSAGKSTLINRLTNTESKVAPYAFTTVSVIPGMLIYKEAYIQILDVPGLIEGAQRGKGRGKEVLSVARGADLLLIMSDVKRTGYLNTMIKELEEAGIRINKVKPQVKIDKKVEGGLEVHTNLRQDLDIQMVKDIANEFGIKNGDITLKEKVSVDSLIDSFSKSRVYIPAIFVVNKIDENKPKDVDDSLIYISAENGSGIDNLLDIIWHKLNLIKVYLIGPDEEPNFNSPVIMKENETLEDILPKLGSSFEIKYKMAKIWGGAARFPGQEVPLTTPLSDNLQVRFI
jgi:hypothetical protein